MYAIVEIAGLQYKVEKDQRLYVNRLNVEAGKKVKFDRVLLIEEKGVPFFIEEISNSDIVQLKFIETLEKAKAFIGMEVSVESEDIEINNESNLIGFKVEILGSQREGIVRSIDTYPQGNMINCVINGKEILIPEVEEWITAIDLDLKVISLELPEGLLEL